MRRQRGIRLLISIFIVVALLLLLPYLSIAGSLEPTPDAVDPSGNPVPTMKTLDEVLPAWSQKLRADDGDHDGCNSSRFKCVLNGEAVLDKETGLVWGRTLGTETLPWSSARYHCYNSLIGGRKGWRLPTVHEIASIVDWTLSPPGLPNGHPFALQPEYPEGRWWTENTVGYWWNEDGTADDYTGWAYCVCVQGVWIGTCPKYLYKHVWCVRGGLGVDVE